MSVLVVNGSLDLTVRAARFRALLFHLAIQSASTEFRCARQINRARGARVLERQREVEHCDFFRVNSLVNVVVYQSFPSAGAFGVLLALKLSRSQRFSKGSGTVHSQH